MSGLIIPEFKPVFLERSIELAQENIENGGGPFGAVVVQEDEIIAEGTNQVTATNDPSSHAEIVAGRAACQILGSFQLKGAVLYSSCEPCPMCLGFTYWARPDGVFYASTRQQAAEIDFDDEFIYEELARPISDRKIPFVLKSLVTAQRVFDAWSEKTDKVEY